VGKGLRLTLILFTLVYLAFPKDIHVNVIVKGRVEKIFVKEGDLVKKGQKLLKVSDELYKLKLKALEAKLLQLEEKRKKAERYYKRYEEMFNRDLLAESVLEDKRTELKVLIYRIQEIKAEIERIRKLIDYTDIKSPFSGKVKSILVGEGSFVNGELIPQPVVIIEPVKNFDKVP